MVTPIFNLWIHARQEKRNRGARSGKVTTDFEYGERQYTTEDLAGHQWTFSETLVDIAPETWVGRPSQPIDLPQPASAGSFAFAANRSSVGMALQPTGVS
jgi:hypothetical protein